MPIAADSGRSSTAIIGGGISGVASALALIDAGRDVTLFESSDRLGGKVAETTIDGIRCPTGPDAFLSRRPEVTALAERLGLKTALMHPSAGSARIYRDGRLHPLPPNVLGVPATEAVDATGLISHAGAARAAEDLADETPHPAHDETVGAMVRRRLGDEVLEYLVDPLLGGINAGDSDRLSLRTGVPQLADLRRAGPSLIRTAAARLAGAPKNAGPVFTSVAGGLNRLFDAAAQELEASPLADLRLATPATPAPSRGTWTIGAERFDHVVLTTPAHTTARLLTDVDPASSAEIAQVPYASVALTVLVLPPNTIAVDPSISGVLVPRLCGLDVTAVSFASHKWPSLAPDGRQILRVSVGRRTHTDWQTRTDGELIDSIRADLSTIFETAVPEGPAVVTRWMDSLPQFEVGHDDRMARVDAALAHSPGLHVSGAWRFGLGLPACVETAQDCVRMISA